MEFLVDRTSQNLKDSLKSSLKGSVTEERYIKEMLAMREEVLIKKGVLYFLLPAVFVGILAYIFPYVFAVTPTHFTEICACDYFYRPKTNYYLILD